MEEKTLNRVRMLRTSSRRTCRHLKNNGKLSNKVLAHKIGLAPSSCLQRVRRLKSLGVLVGSHAEVDPDSVGVGLQAMISIRVVNQSRGTADSVVDYLSRHKEVVAIYCLSGATDYLVHVAVKDTKHLRSLLLDELLRQEELAHIETSIIFEYRRSHVLPSYLENDDVDLSSEARPTSG